MDGKLVLRVKKRSQAQWLVWLIVILPFAFGTLLDLFRLPNAIKYICDVCWLLLLVIMALSRKTELGQRKTMFAFVGAFLLFTLLTYVINYQSVAYYLWGVRNNFRVYVAFFAFATFLDVQDIKDYLKLFDSLFWINAVVCVFQFFVLGLNQDFLGGLFGTQKGCNAYTSMFFTIVVIKAIVYYLNKKENLLYCASKCIVALIISAMAEIKFFFIEFVLILVLSVFFTNFSWRKVILIIVGFSGIILGVSLLSIIFPSTLGFLDIESLIEATTSDKGYTATGDLNRLNAIAVISEEYLTEFDEQIIGLGLGNCDTATYEFLATPFYEEYSWLHYFWFSTAHTFFETGYIGLLFFFGFFVLCFGVSKSIGAKHKEYKMYCDIASIMAISCVLIATYNSSLRTEAGYMAYLVLAFPFIVGVEAKNKANLEGNFDD